MTEREIFEAIKRIHDECMDAKRQARGAMMLVYVAMGISISALILIGSMIMARFIV